MQIQVYKPNSTKADFTANHFRPETLVEALRKELAPELTQADEISLSAALTALKGMSSGKLPAEMVQMRLGDRRIKLKQNLH